MSSRVRPCCVPGCDDREAKRHTITTKGKCRDIWLQRINNEKLFNLDAQQLKSFRICDIHFATVCKEELGRLKNRALPTLHLPGYESVENDNFLPPSPETQVFKVVTPEKLKGVIQVLGPSGSQTSESSPVGSVSKPRRVYGRKRLFQDTLDCDSQTPLHKRGTIEEPSTSRYLSSTSAFHPRTLKKQVPRLTSTEMIMKQQLIKLKIAANRAKRNHLKTKRKLRFLQKQENMMNFLKYINKTTYTFLSSQLRNQKLKPKGRRFTIDDKIFALSIFKQSGKGYRFLSKIFSLPSRKTLKKLLNAVPFNCGINAHIFAHLKNIVNNMKDMDKSCMLMFDEISLSTGISYDQKTDSIQGLVDFGGAERKAIFADHALVFMLKGIHRNWKQPICFYFCEHTTATADLIRIIKDVVRQVRRTGLDLIATVCDQEATNNAAIKQLLRDTNSYCLKNQIENRYQGYLIDGIEVVHLFDCPHLMKGIRNGLLTKNLHFRQENIDKVASWSHVIDIYRVDRQRGKFSQFPKLTDEHVLPQKIRKMKVKNCTQVFSWSVATAMNAMAEVSRELSPESIYYIDPVASQTADLLLFFDGLFDSVNSSALKPSLGKELRGVVTSKSKHLEVWRTALPVLNSMFFSNSPSSHIVTPSIKNWIFTLRGFLYIWDLLKNKKFRFVSPRSFNQDPLENFFSLIRSHGLRNTNPTCTSFISSTKALLVNNFMSSHSPSSNCEEDASLGALDTLKYFLINEHKEISSNVELPIALNPTTPDPPKSPVQTIDLANSYVAGAVAKKLLKINNCKVCTTKILTEEDIPQNLLIKKRQYQAHSLCTPSHSFLKLFDRIACIIYDMLPRIINHNNIKKKIIQNLQSYNNEIHLFFCDNHKNYSLNFLNIATNMCIFHYIKIVNNVLNGKDLRYKDLDIITNAAYNKFIKQRKNKG